MIRKSFAASAVILLAACSQHGVSESDLEDAISERVAKQKICVPFQLDVSDRLPNESPFWTTFGAPEIKLLKRLENGKRANEHASKQMEALVRAGIYKADKEERIGEGEQAARYAVYTLVKDGNGYISSEAHQRTLCIGTQKFKKINFFTIPSDAHGMTVTHVSYEAKVQPEKWANSLIKEENNTPLFNQTHNYTMTLMKTNEGWRDTSLLHE